MSKKVRCVDTVAANDRVTRGKTYDVMDYPDNAAVYEFVDDRGGISRLLKERFVDVEEDSKPLQTKSIFDGTEWKIKYVPTYAVLAAEIAATVTEKQQAYGDSFGKSGAVMKLLYPDGIPPEKYDDALCVVRIVDKLFRIATDRDALGESPYRDVVGYGLLGAARGGGR